MTDYLNGTILFEVARCGHVRLFKLIYKRDPGAVHWETDHHDTVFHTIAKFSPDKEGAEIIAFLHEKGHSPNSSTSYRHTGWNADWNTALELALTKGKKEVAKTLLRIGCNHMRATSMNSVQEARLAICIKEILDEDEKSSEGYPKHLSEDLRNELKEEIKYILKSQQNGRILVKVTRFKKYEAEVRKRNRDRAKRLGL